MKASRKVLWRPNAAQIARCMIVAVLGSVIVALGVPSAVAADDHTENAHDAIEHASDAAAVDLAEHDLHAEQHPEDGHAHGEHGPVPLRVDPDLAIWTALVFGGLYFVLAKFAWQPILAAVDQRESQVSEYLSVAKNQDEEAQRLIEQYDQQLRAAGEEVREVVEEARRNAEREKAEILAEAKSATAAEHQRSLDEVLAARQAAMAEIGQMAGGLAVQLAGKVIERDVHADQHSAMVRNAVSGFSAKDSGRKG